MQRSIAWMREARDAYANLEMLTLLGLGFSSGLPRLLVYSTLTFWLLDSGMSVATVGLFALTSLPYSFKFIWAPLLDRVPLGPLTAALGQRRAWILVTQVALAASILGLAASDPKVAPVVTGIMAIAVAFFSASQDIVIDAYRVDLLDDDEQGAGAAVAVFGYRLGMLAAGAGALAMAAWTADWSIVYGAMAALVGVGVLSVFIGRAPEATTSSEDDGDPEHQLLDAVWGPFRDLLTRRGAVVFLLFIMLYKLGDALAGAMVNPLLHELEFTNLEIAGVAKTYGLVASIVGVFLGGWLVKHVGVMRSLWIAGFMQMFSNLAFVFQAVVGHDVLVLTATMGIENLCGGFGTAAFVAYLSGLCQQRYTATQYALLTATSSLVRLVLSAFTGLMATALGWPLYFGITAAAAIPGIIMIHVMQRYHFTGLEEHGGDDEVSEGERVAQVMS